MQIPAFLSVDVEPEGFQVSRHDPPRWAGYEAVYELVSKFRYELARASGNSPQFGWYYRMDPQIGLTYGRPDYALKEYPELAASLRLSGDYFGVHAHPVRWSDSRESWVHDFSNSDWLRNCVNYSLDAFEDSCGSPVTHFRFGAGFLNNDIISVLDDRGVTVDLTLEPVKGWGVNATEVQTAVDSSPIVGTYTNCFKAPRAPYQPSLNDFLVSGNENARSIVMIPLTSGSFELPSTIWRLRLRRFMRSTLASTPISIFYPTLDWPNADYFWNLVAHELRSMRRPYLSIAIRSDAPGSSHTRKVSELLEALIHHPLAKSLRFVDPADVLGVITQPLLR